MRLRPVVFLHTLIFDTVWAHPSLPLECFYLLLCHPTAGLLLVELFKTSGAQQEVVCDFDLLLGLATSFATSPGDDCFVKWMRMSWRFSAVVSN